MTATRPCSSCDTAIAADAAFCPVCGTPSASPILAETLVGASRTPSGSATSYELAPERLQAALGPNYELGRLIGRGGYAEVFAVRDLRLKRELAVKVLRPDLILTDALVARFRREAEAVAALQNPHIVPVYDIGESEGVCWLLMPLVQGETLKSILAREPRLPVEEVRRILLQAAEALQAAHAAGVVHRDIKPENLMLDGKSGRVLLMDFGIAKAMDASAEHSLTGTGVVIGTPQYMSPEQAMGGHAPDPRSDQYSLAVVGYQMLAGRVPFEGENVREVMARQLLEEAIPLSRLVPGIPAAISSTIHQALRKEAKRRFSSLDAFARSLRGEAVAVSEGGAVRRESKFNIPERRRPWLAVGVGVLVLAAGGWAANRAGLFADTPPPPPAQVNPATPPAASPPPAARKPPGGTRTTGATATAPAETTTAAVAPPAPPATCESAFRAQDWTTAFAKCTAERDTSAAAERNLGLLYAAGHGVKQDEHQAAVHLGFAARDADTIAVVEMAHRYETGRGVVMDQARAAGFYNTAANLGVKEAYAVLAKRYAEGNGLRPDPKQAAYWYEKAANEGDAPSMTRLGAAYAAGRGVKKDEWKSAFWFTKAAELREPEAEYELATRLLNGKGGMKKDETAGLGWLQRAADHGWPAAVEEVRKRRG